MLVWPVIWLLCQLAWVGRLSILYGSHELRGFHVWDSDTESNALKDLPAACRASLTQLVKCDPYTLVFLEGRYRGSLEDDDLAQSVCDKSCATSLESWFKTVDLTCAGYSVSGSAATKYGGQIWSGWNETCLKDPTSGKYCNDIIADFPAVDFLEELPNSKLCSFCFVERLKMMQRSSYSFFDESFQSQLKVVNEQCGLNAPTDLPPSLDAPPNFLPDPICSSNRTHTTLTGDTCDSIALKYNISSAALVMANNRQLMKCDGLAAGMDLCLPVSCAATYLLKGSDTCHSIESTITYRPGSVRRYNPWVDWDCSNLQRTTEAWGRVICLASQGGKYTATAPIPGVTLSPDESSEYSTSIVDPPSNATVATGTTMECGKWHVALEGETCAQICIRESLTSALFLQVNPSLPRYNCSAALVAGEAYCVAPNSRWKN